MVNIIYGDKMEINKYMTKHIITSNINSNINDLAILMKDYDIGFIPISEDNKIIGVITDRDIIIGPIYNNDNKINKYKNTKILHNDEKKKYQ